MGKHGFLASIPAEAMANLELPALDERICTGCGDCVAVCPQNCLEMAGSLPWLARPAHCLSCSLCVLVCSAQALHLELPAGE